MTLGHSLHAYFGALSFWWLPVVLLFIRTDRYHTATDSALLHTQVLNPPAPKPSAAPASAPATSKPMFAFLGPAAEVGSTVTLSCSYQQRILLLFHMHDKTLDACNLRAACGARTCRPQDGS